MLLFYGFYCSGPINTGVSSYVFSGGFGYRCVGWMAGDSPAATHFLLAIAQKKVRKEKAIRLSGSLRCPTKTGPSGNEDPIAETEHPDDHQDSTSTLNSANLIADYAYGSYANSTFNTQSHKDSDHCERALLGLRISDSLSLWKRAGVRAARCRFFVVILTPANPHSDLFPAGEGEGQAQGKDLTDQPGNDKAQHLAPESASASVPASPVLAGPLSAPKNGIRAAHCLSRRRVCADPRFSGRSKVARSEAQGPGQPGRLSFAYFSLAKQRKVSCRRATPGQPATAEIPHFQIKNSPATNSIAIQTDPAYEKSTFDINSVKRPAGVWP